MCGAGKLAYLSTEMFMVLKISHHYLICHNLNLNQVLQVGMLEVGSLSFWSHIQSRGECCSELSCLRSEDLLTTTSFITSEVINSGIIVLVCFLQAELP